jgi:arsenate reductase (thioredoxin)
MSIGSNGSRLCRPSEAHTRWPLIPTGIASMPSCLAPIGRPPSRTMTDQDGSSHSPYGTFDPDGDAVAARRTVLFVCRHGAAKSVLAAADFRRFAAERGLDIDAVAAGLDPDPEVMPVLIEALRLDDPGERQPRVVTAADISSASWVVTFNLVPDELPSSGRSVERWDDVPSVTDNLKAARGTIDRYLERLIEECSRSPGADRHSKL